jgi:separase
MAEQVAVYMQPVEYRPEVACLLQALLRRAIDAYRSSSCPFRQTRCILRFVEHSLSTGAETAVCEEMISEAFCLLQGDVGQDIGLLGYKSQYEGELHMAVASIAYASRSPVLMNILAARAKAARQCFLSLVDRPQLHVSPIARKLSRKTGLIDQSPDLKVSRIDDRLGLCLRLDKFIGLLGMHSHALDQVEFLRLKRGLERNDGSMLNGFVLTSARLASEYVRLGKFTRAGTIFASARNLAARAPSNALSVDERVDFELRYALYLAAVGDTQKSGEVYDDIRRVSQPEVQQKGGSSTAKIRQRCATLERAAAANLVLAEIAHIRDNAVATIHHRSVAFRLLSRAAENMARIAPRAASVACTPTTVPEDPFGPALMQPYTGKPEDAPPVDDVRAEPKSSSFKGKQLVGKHLNLITALLSTSLQLGADMLMRGSARDALAFVKEAKSLAETTGSSYWVAKTSCALTEIHIALRDYVTAASNIEESARLLSELGGPEAAEAYRILADLQSRQIDTEEDSELIEAAHQAFQATQEALMRLENSFSVSDNIIGTPARNSNTPTKRITSGNPSNSILAATRSKALIQQARLLRKLDQLDESNELLEQARSIHQGAMSEVDELHILGTTAFSAALSRFKSDLFLNSITESTISMPVGTVNEVDDDIKQGRSAIAATLHDAETAYQRYISLRGNAGDITDVRDATVAAAMLRAYQASLGRNSVQYTRGAASLLGESLLSRISTENI